MRITRRLALGASMLALVSACSTGGGGTSASPTAGSSASSSAPASATTAPTATQAPPAIKIGSDGFYESKIMAEIYGQVLEANGYTVDRAGIGLGTRTVTAPALESGQIDLKPEYVGSGLAYYVKQGKSTTNPSGDSAANQQALAAALKTVGGGITVFDYTPAIDINAFVVRAETASQYSLKTMTDLGKVASQLKLGVATDCPTNPLCAKALKDAYGIDVSGATKLAACDTPMAQALAAKTIDVGELCSTQPDIAKNGWVVLEDDQHTQPADNIAPLVRDDYLAKLPDKDGFAKILNDVSAKMTTDMLTKLNAEFVFDKKDVKDIAAGWLKDNGFTK